ncbi:ABC transporter substrate-binding protein [Cryobacterium tepidiphilum]|uniref:Sugar ABC transporter substrate-binding protein n=1 Tax=Cryobacterium tepidiphilum TaxID=2486026 RepID=A0A3M8LNZ1_9MICO|nr:sugar ABC transporter substrate-binding protein [Cryobacterium tepidiphilum]RNE67210.1 sugar ABC transporter substrate-binding protein [Cryobacterium tepidiphilum]
MKLSTFLLPTATVAAVALLSGCAAGGAGTGTSPTALDPDAKVSGEITVWSWDTAAAGLKRLGVEYEKSHPGTTVKVVDVGYDNAYDKLSVGLQAGSGLPDVVTIETDRAPGYISEFPQGLTDLTPVLGDKKADFDPSKWSAGSNADGKLMVAPWDSGTVGLFYRSDYLAAAGVDPASLGTWDDLVAAGEKIKQATGHTLMSIDVSSGSTFAMMLQQQGQGLFDDNGDITVNSPEAVHALTLLKEMNDKGLIKNVKGWDGRVTATKDGDSAVHPEAVWWIGTLTGEMPELAGKFGVVPLPAFDDGARTSNNGGSNLAIPTQAKNPQLAASFIGYALADADNQVSLMKNEGLFPSYLPALKSDYFQQADPYFGGQKVYELFAAETANIPSITFTTDNAKALDIVANAVVASVVGGDDPKKALDDAAKQIATATGRAIAE